MLTRLKQMKTHFEELAQQVGDPEVIADQARWRELVKEHSRLEPIIAAYDAYMKTEAGILDFFAIVYHPLINELFRNQMILFDS